MSDPPGVLTKLPPDLHYLIEPALRYGRYQFDDDIFDFLDRATDEDIEHLTEVAARVLRNGDFTRVNSFLDKHPITTTDEAARLYFLFLVMDYADLQFDRVSDSAP